MVGITNLFKRKDDGDNNKDGDNKKKKQQKQKQKKSPKLHNYLKEDIGDETEVPDYATRKRVALRDPFQRNAIHIAVRLIYYIMI